MDPIRIVAASRQASPKVFSFLIGVLFAVAGDVALAANNEPIDFAVPGWMEEASRVVKNPVASFDTQAPRPYPPHLARSRTEESMTVPSPEADAIYSVTSLGSLIRGGGERYSPALINTSLPLAPGRLPSSFDVGSTGTASYSIPLRLPPGAKGLQPSLAFVYSSDAGDSVMGPGWSLAGLSSIARCIQTWVQDVAPAPLTLTTSDKFCLDGNRLRLTGGTYGFSGSTYQTEIETFSRVTASGTAGGGPSYFTVETRDGLIYEYGNTADSKAYTVGGTTPYTWLLNKIRDRQGNNLIVSYTTTNGATRPTSIQYTQTPSMSGAYPYTISFSYQARVTNSARYVAGGQIVETQVLGAVTISNNGSTVRTYNIGYQTAPSTWRDRVYAIQECTPSDCLKTTSITYQDGTAGFAAASTSAGTGATTGKANTVDIDGDGKQDLVYAIASGANFAWHVKFASGAGYGSAINTGVVTTPTAPVLFDDFDANGKVDLLSLNSTTWYVLKWTGSTFTWTSTGLAIDGSRPANANWDFVPADVNGDGLPDLVSYRTDFKIYTRLNTTSGGSVSFSGTSTLAFTVGRPVLGLWGNNSVPNSSVRQMDFNGDGREEVIFRYLGSWPNLLIYDIALFSQGTTFINGFAYEDNGSVAPMPVRWNDDSCVDITFGGRVWIASCGSGFPTSISAGGQIATDWDGDGRTDLLYSSGGTWQLTRSLGTAVASPVNTGVPSGSGSWMLTDQNGDGLSDIALIDSSASNAINFGLHNGANTPPDMATNFVDGFNMSVTFSYAAMTGAGSCYVRDSAAPTFPKRVVMSPIYTMCSVVASDGIGGTFTNTYSYYNANAHLQGRGFLGFERRYGIDSRDGNIHMLSFNQDFPNIGAPGYYLLRQSDWTRKIKEVTNTYSQLNFGSGFETRAYGYVSQSIDDAYEVGGALDNQLITRTTTNVVSMDSYGNPTNTTVAISDQSTASPYYGETYTTQSITTVSPNTTNWCLNLPTQQTVQSTIPGGTSQMRTTSATVDYVGCRNTQEIIEPSSSTLRVTTNYGFDTCGNVNSISVVGKNPDGSDMPARTTTAYFGTRCQFPESSVNALGQTSYVSYNYGLGVVSGSTDANGLAFSWQYDGYGRKTYELRPDSTSTTWIYVACNGSDCGPADLKWYAFIGDKDNAGSWVRYSYFYFDGMDRERYDERLNLAGSYNVKQTQYDSRGNAFRVHVPYLSSGGGNGYSDTLYDVVNRPTTVTLYNSAGGFDRQSTVGYAGRTVTFTDALGNASSRLSDVRGKLRRVVDPAPGGTTNYTYDAFGNLATAVDPIGAALSNGYNLRGFRTSFSSADQGSWTASVNSLGETVSQTDAKSQTMNFTFDALGRMATRQEAEGTSTWTWGTSAAAKNIGSLSSVTGPGYSETYSYDGFGRLQLTDYSADTAYQVNYAYAANGMLDTVTYPTSTNGCRFTVRYGYFNGILNALWDASSSLMCGSTGTLLWQVSTQNAMGAATDETLGNGVRILTDVDNLTGHMNNRRSGTSAGSYENQQKLAYVWDKNENLKERVDQLQSGSGCASAGLCEKFDYDTLNRLTNTTLNGLSPQAVAYDASGNITSRTGMGSYGYDPTRKHAVNAVNGWTFGYDNNGNMTSGRGATITWTSYNKPASITNGSIYSLFSYTPARQYWKQVANYSDGLSTTIYIGSLLEKVTSAVSGHSDYRHMVATNGATVVVSRSTTGTNNFYYATKDHLGSSSVVTNQSAGVLVSESFDAWGKRRGSGWTGTPSSGDWSAIASTTRRGFTGHTMVDNMSLVHMNGRVYDPEIGRFMSPDPLINGGGDSQGLNLFAYARNNPLNITDPSGYGWLSKLLNPFHHFHLKAFALGITMPLLTFAAIHPIGSISTYYSIRANERLMLKYPWYATANVAAACYWGGPWACAGANARLAHIRGGEIGDIVIAAVGGYFSAGTNAGTFGGFAKSLAKAYVNDAVGNAMGKIAAKNGIDMRAVNGVLTALNVIGIYRRGQAVDSSGQHATPSALGDILDLPGKIWSLPNTVIGLVYGGLGHITGWLMGTNPGISIANNAIQFTNNPLMVTAMTFGNVVVYGRGMEPDKSWASAGLAYEEGRHTIQAQILGPLNFPAHIFYGFRAIFSTWGSKESFSDRWHAPANVLERGPHSDPSRAW